MPIQGFLHHIDFTVSDPVAARPLYDLFLGHAGFILTRDRADGPEWGLKGRRYPSIGLGKTRGPNAARTHDRYSPGLHHLALAASSREDVDALHEKLVTFGADILDPPADYPEYGAGYYAVFFADPDGLKLEYAFTPEPQEILREKL